MKVIISTRARAEMFDIGVWIERDNPERAWSFVEELHEACEKIGDFPRSYSEAPEFGAGIRKRSHGDYLILYRVTRHVTILSIRHSARDRGPLGGR